jgi:type I restriction enzyme, S subunit
MGRTKTAWKRVRFADMVTSAGATRKARGWTAGDERVERYVGLEHLDTNSPKIRRWGSPETVGENSDLRHFEAGDVILARRGIEQRKVGVADFRGVASGHALVFRARPEVVLPTFLPYFLLSDSFMNRVLNFSAGSLSKTVNLSALMKQEFALPPLEEQRRLVEVLVAAARVREAHVALIQGAELAEMAEIQARFADRHSWPHSAMHQLCEIQLGQQKHPKFERGENMRPFLRVANLSDGYLDVSDLQHMSFPGAAATKHQLRAGDLVVTEGDLIGPRNVGRAAMFRGEIKDCCVQKTLIRVRPRTNVVLPGYLVWAFRHLRYDGTFAKAASGSTVAHLVQEKFREVSCPVAPRMIQEQIADAADRSYRMRPILQKRVADAMALWERTLNTAVPQ